MPGMTLLWINKYWSEIDMFRNLILTSGQPVLRTECLGGIDAKRINSEVSNVKFKRFNLFFLPVAIKTIYITVYNWHRDDQQSPHMKRRLPLHMKGQLPLHVKKWSPLHMKRWLPLLIPGGWINDQQREDQQSTFTFTWKGNHLCWSGGSMINKERINSQFSLSHEKVITSVDPGCRLMINKERINSQLSLLHEKLIASVDPRWGWIDNQHTEDQQSTFTIFHVLFKRFNLFLLHVGLKNIWHS